MPGTTTAHYTYGKCQILVRIWVSRCSRSPCTDATYWPMLPYDDTSFRSQAWRIAFRYVHNLLTCMRECERECVCACARVCMMCEVVIIIISNISSIIHLLIDRSRWYWQDGISESAWKSTRSIRIGVQLRWNIRLPSYGSYLRGSMSGNMSFYCMNNLLFYKHSQYFLLLLHIYILYLYIA